MYTRSGRTTDLIVLEVLGTHRRSCEDDWKLKKEREAVGGGGFERSSHEVIGSSVS